VEVAVTAPSGGFPGFGSGEHPASIATPAAPAASTRNLRAAFPPRVRLFEIRSSCTWVFKLTLPTFDSPHLVFQTHRPRHQKRTIQKPSSAWRSGRPSARPLKPSVSRSLPRIDFSSPHALVPQG